MRDNQDEEEVETAEEPERLHVLQVPDELLAWVQQPEVASTMRAPLGRMAERLVKRSDRHPLSKSETDSLLSLLDGIAGAAMRAGRDDLLTGLDVHTASLLNLHFTTSLNGKPVTIGPKGRWWFEEVAMVQATDDPQSARDFVEKVKDLIADVFPDAHIGSIGHVQPFVCTGCAREMDEGALVELADGINYCGACWANRTRDSAEKKPPPMAAPEAKKQKRGKNKKKPVEVEEEQLDLLGDRDLD